MGVFATFEVMYRAQEIFLVFFSQMLSFSTSLFLQNELLNSHERFFFTKIRPYQVSTFAEIPFSRSTHQKRHLLAVYPVRRSGVTRLAAPGELPLCRSSFQCCDPSLYLVRTWWGTAARAAWRKRGKL